MDKASLVASLIEDIYDAALDPAHWTGALNKIAKFVDAFAVAIVAQDEAGDVHYDHHHGLDPYYQQIYLEKYRRWDPRTPLHASFKVGVVFDSFALLPAREFRETQFYQEYLQPQGVTENPRYLFQKSPVSYFGAFRREGGNGSMNATIRRMGLLMPHVRRAVEIGKTIAVKGSETTPFIGTLDGLRAGVFLLDGALRIVHINSSGHDLLARRVFTRTANGRLSIGDPHARGKLAAAIAAAAEVDAATGRKSLSMCLKGSDREHYVAHLLPLTSGERCHAGKLCDASAALFVYQADAHPHAPAEIIAARYQLTPMEVSVLFAIVEVGGVPEVAEALGIAQSTVKTHLLRIFAKTDSRRQADLAKLVFAYSNPLTR